TLTHDLITSDTTVHSTTALAFPMFIFLLFFFKDTATTEIYTLSLHDALPISWPFGASTPITVNCVPRMRTFSPINASGVVMPRRSEEHTSELQSLAYLVCRLLLEKKKKKKNLQEFTHYVRVCAVPVVYYVTDA